MSKRILGQDKASGVTTWHDYDHSSKKTYITETQDAETIIEANKRAQRDGVKSKSHYQKIGSIPVTVLMEWQQKYGIDHTKKEDFPKIERLLMSNEYKYLRTVDRI